MACRAGPFFPDQDGFLINTEPARVIDTIQNGSNGGLFVNLLLRFALPLLAVLLVMAAALTPLVDKLVSQWFRHDLEIRSRLIFNSVEDTLSLIANSEPRQEMTLLFERIAEDERILAIGWCSPSGRLETASKAWPQNVACSVIEPDAPLFTTKPTSHGPVLYAGFPVAANTGNAGQFVVLHDLSFAERRSFAARLYLWGLLAALGAASATVTILTARVTLAGWIESFRRILQTPGAENSIDADPQIAPVISEIRQLIRDLDISRRTAAGIRVDWTPDTLRRVLNSELPGVELPSFPIASLIFTYAEMMGKSSCSALPVALSRRSSRSCAPVAAPGSLTAAARPIARRPTAIAISLCHRMSLPIRCGAYG
jgi:hypothetical protein